MQIHIRVAKLSDVEQLAQVHWICSAEQPGSFMYKLGKTFLKQYYRILLQEKNSIVLCAEDENGNILGLVSGSLKAEEHMIALRRNKFRLLLAAIPSLIRNPHLIGDIYSRQTSMSADEKASGYIVLSGAREEFWGWLPSQRLAGGAIELHEKWLSFVRLLGASEVKLEVDRVNEKVEKMHRLMGAKVVKEFTTPDGKQRLVMEYLLK
jgi:hypothetical protein